MYIIDGIAYAGETTLPVRICGVRPLDGYKLWIRFNTGETGIFDFTPLLSAPAFVPLREPEIFRSVYIDYDTAVWQDGEIDIAPEYLYENAVMENRAVS